MTDWTVADDPEPTIIEQTPDFAQALAQASTDLNDVDGVDRTSDAPIVQQITYDGLREVIYRASSVGGCPRKLWAARSGYPEAPIPQKMQDAYERGHVAEPLILAQLEARGWELRNRQGEIFFQVFTLPSGTVVSVIGHWDCEARYPIAGQEANHTHDAGWSEWYPCDVKNFGPAFVSKFKSRGLAEWPHYQWQQSIYVLGHPTANAYLMPIWDYEHEEFVSSSLYPTIPDFTLADLEQRLMSVEHDFLNSRMPDCILEWPCPYWNKLHDEKPQSVLPDEVKGYITARQNADAKIKLWTSAKDTMTDEILKLLSDTVGEFSCTWENHTISIQANSSKFKTQHAKDILKEAGFDITSEEFNTPGKGVKLVITTK